MTAPRINDPEPSQYLRPAEACQFARCGRTWLTKQERLGRLKAYRPSSRLTLYKREDLARLIEAKEGQS